MMKHCLISGVSAFLIASVCIVSATADEVTLKDGLDGYTGTEDTRANYTSTPDWEYSYGGLPTALLSSKYYRMLMRFDVTALSNVKTVHSAILRLYMYNGAPAGEIQVNELTENWEEGVSISSGDRFDGAHCFARQVGTDVPKINLTVYNHNGTDIYYIGGVTNLALDPNDGVDHYIYGYYVGFSFLRSHDLQYRHFVQAVDLDALILTTDDATHRHYTYDDASDRLYVRTNLYSFMYLGEENMWADAIWDGTMTLGPKDNSIDTSHTYKDTDGLTDGWIEVDLTALAEKWIVDGSPNLGMFVRTLQYNDGRVACSEQVLKWDPVNEVWEGDPSYIPANGVDVRPELVMSYS